MLSEATKLPDNVTELKQIIASFQSSLASSKEKERQYQADIKILKEQVAFYRDKLFGRSSEKHPLDLNPPQLLLFDEPGEIPSEESSPPNEEIEVPAHRRKKPGRKPLPKDLPRVDVIHDLKEEEKICECGCRMSRIGEEKSEKLDIIPAKVRVIRHIRYKYACKNCEGVESETGAVKIAPAPEQIIPKSIATPGLLAYVLTSKFVDHLPFYRQEDQFARIGVNLSRATMANWSIKVAEHCKPLLSLLHKEVLSGPLVNIDETTVQVLKEPGRANTSKSYMWVFRGGPPEKPTLIFQYHPTRSGDVASEYLRKYKGYIQTDGYSGYNALGQTKGIIHVGCWGHARRKFVEVQNAAKNIKNRKSKTGSADVALNYISKLYAIEKRARSLDYTPEQLYKARQEKARPILDDFKKWLEKRALQTPPKGLLGKAISYTLNEWKKLIQYINDGLLRPDNNLAENAIRPFVVGRKNWLFSGSPKGAEASAALYSLIETAKANGLEPYLYLRYLFENLPFAHTTEDYKKLLPQYINKDLLVVPR
jgi:transposase